MRNILLIFIAFSFVNLQGASSTDNNKFENDAENKKALQTSKISDSIDLSKYKEIQKRDNKIIFDANSSDSDGIYNYDYKENIDSKNSETNVFLDGNFDKIYRYKSLYFSTGSLDSNSNKIFKKILQRIHSYTDDKSREIVVSILGFTQKIENKNEEMELNSGYTSFFQNIARRDNLNHKTANKDALNYMEIVYNKILDDNISKEILYKENRVGKDNLYTEEFIEGRDLNNRVDLAIYVKEVYDPDTDGDGVHDSKDYCPETALGANVDKNGCPRIMSLDLKFDFDKATISEQESIDNVQKISQFMNKYPVYNANIIGHTDSDGEEKYNQELSLRRAKVVKELMIKEGINESRISYEGRGENEPLFENINPLNRHKNRRTEVELTIPQERKRAVKPRLRSRGFDN